MTGDVTDVFLACAEEALWDIFERPDGSAERKFDVFVERLQSTLTMNGDADSAERVAALLSPDAHTSAPGQLNPLWLHRGFILPIVAAHAALQSDLLAPNGRGTITVILDPHQAAIFGVQLISVSAPNKTRAERRANALHFVSSMQKVIVDETAFRAALVHSEQCLSSGHNSVN